MGRFLGGIFAIAIAAGQPLPNLGFGSVNAGYHWYGPKTVYPGFSHYYQFSGISWRVPVTCSATGNTCNSAGSGYTPTGTETAVYVTATDPPSGLETMLTGAVAPYDLCHVSGTQFQLCRTGTSVVETFSSTGTSVSILLSNAAIRSTAHTFITSNTGWPAGTTLSWAYGPGLIGPAFPSPNGNPENYQHAQQMLLRADIPSSAAPGDYAITIVSCTTDTTGGTCAGLSDTLTFTITVTALTYLSDATEPTSFPAIPGLSAWVGYMTSGGGGGGGADWCNKTTGVTNPTDQTSGVGNGSDVQYYDGGLNYWRIAIWTRDASWKNCTQNILQQIGWGNAASITFPHGYIVGTNGATQGFQVFPVGYETAVSQDARYIAMLQYYAALMDSPYGGFGGTAAVVQGCTTASDTRVRENAYALDVILAIDRMGLTPTHDQPGTPALNTWVAKRQRCADTLIQTLDAYVNNTFRYSEHQYFFDGLAMDALIHWWQVTKDPRVPLIVKPILDQYYSNYNLSAHIGMWNPDASGTPRCNNSNLWWNPQPDGHCHDNTTVFLPQLHHLFDHAFAWYWRVSGDDTYRTEGDEVFSHGLYPADKGKSFSQLYRYSFDYVGWRQGWLSPERSVD